MITSYLDHIAVTAATLEDGIDYIHRTIGVMPQIGGEHPRMGTHNYFLKLGDKLYLEVIAIDPKANRPDRPRWFGLDNLVPEKTPGLATWIVRTNDITCATKLSPIDHGRAEPMSRGNLNWHITIAEDGRPPLDGIAPTLIQWQDSSTHPATSLQDLGCSLILLQGFHPQAEKIQSALDAIGFNGNVEISYIAAGELPHLIAHIATPFGQRTLRTVR